MSDETNDHNIKMFNIAKTQLLAKLVGDNLLDKDVATEFNARCEFVLFKPKWYKRYWNAVSGDKDKETTNNYHVKLVDFINRDEALEQLTNE